MKIEMLYPEICNLYGDRANAGYLALSCGAELICTYLSDTPRFLTEDIGLVYMGGTTEKGQLIVRDTFRPYLEGLVRRTDAGGVTLITGNAMEIFGQYIEKDDGSKDEMLGLFPFWSTQRLLGRYNSVYWGKFGDLDIVAHKAQFGHSYGNIGEGLFQTVRGAGMNPDVKPEGVRRNNLMATYLLGPLMIFNPSFAKYILGLMGVEDPHLAYEEAAYDVYENRLRQWKDPNRGFLYS